MEVDKAISRLQNQEIGGAIPMSRALLGRGTMSLVQGHQKRGGSHGRGGGDKDRAGAIQVQSIQGQSRSVSSDLFSSSSVVVMCISDDCRTVA